jgi:hypothetical protein
MSSDLQCARCGAPLALPSDFGVWLVRCQYCGFEHELPDRPARQAYAEQQRQDAARAAQAQAQAAAAERARQTTLRGRRATLVGSIAVTLVILVGVTGVVAYAVTHATNAIIPTFALGTTPPPALSALASKATAEGCPTVLDGPSARSGDYQGTFAIVKRECMRFLAVSSTVTPLTLRVTDPAGAVSTRSAPSGTLDTTFCAKENANHVVKISGASPFWLEARTCPRTFANDASTTGMAHVSARLKQLMTHGCYEVSLAASTFSDERKLTTPLDAGMCFDLLAATGVTDNLIQAKISTPFGENIAPLPSPATNLEIPYCAATAGPHTVELSPAVDGPFSIAIAICNRSALPRVLPKATK